jgi:NAD(P)H-flavin reductase
MKFAGQDATQPFMAIHSRKAKDFLSTFFIGKVVHDDNSNGSSTKASCTTSLLLSPYSNPRMTTSSLSLHTTTQQNNDNNNSYLPSASNVFTRSRARNPNPMLREAGDELCSAINIEGFTDCEILHKAVENHNTCVLRIELPDSVVPFSVPICGHITIGKADANQLSGFLCRSYTPIFCDSNYFDVLVKIYSTGKMSPYLHSLNAGDHISVRGPYPGEFTHDHKQFTHLCLIAGGTGIAPFIRLLADRLPDDSKTTLHTTLICCNKTEADILMRSQLTDWSARHSHLSVHQILTQQQQQKDSNGKPNGRITAQCLIDLLPSPSSSTIHTLVCGSTGFNSHIVSLLCDIGFSPKTVTVLEN